MINIHYLQLPPRIKALITKNDDFSYTIILNSRLNFEQNINSFQHEMKHIFNNDFEKLDVDTIELSARSEVYVSN